jgi:hypothetical protein
VAWAGVVGGEVPVHLSLVGVGCLLPGGQLGVEDAEIVDVPVPALPGQRRELDLGDIEPGSVSGGVVTLEALGQTARRGRGEGLVEGAQGVGVEVVHDHHDLGRDSRR